jgi:hypothetical protein
MVTWHHVKDSRTQTCYTVSVHIKLSQFVPVCILRTGALQMHPGWIWSETASPACAVGHVLCWNSLRNFMTWCCCSTGSPACEAAAGCGSRCCPCPQLMRRCAFYALRTVRDTTKALGYGL